ncbi:hypothetical protein OUZ56_003217 [Daphnia magna]|uniref:Uncharacterized protein n=1 Tax=Daphnia magna TaxID=35525 RepID=A0ABR0A896_9CRUS|nr:hypothetical protein OUZ56_003217 [Daphnia magna]
MFFFRLEDESGTIKVKASGEDAEKFYLLIQEGEIYNMQFAEIVAATKPNSIYPFKYEMIICNKTERKVNLWNQDKGILNDLQLKKNVLQAFHPRRYEEREFTTNIHQHLQSFRLQAAKVLLSSSGSYEHLPIVLQSILLLNHAPAIIFEGTKLDLAAVNFGFDLLIGLHPTPSLENMHHSKPIPEFPPAPWSNIEGPRTVVC